MAGIQGLRGTGEFTTDFRPTNYRELYTLLEPNGTAPLNALLAMAGSEATDDPKYNNFRDELPNQVLTVNNAAGYDASATSITIDAGDDNTFATAGTTLVNSRTGEVMLVTADTTATTLTVERNIGSSGLEIDDNDTLYISGSAHEEGSDTPTAISFDPSVAFNYTQIFKTPINITNTLRETYLRTGSKEDEMVTKALKMHMMGIERAMIFGRRHIQNASTSQPRRFTGGMTSTVTNVIDRSGNSGVMDEATFDRTLIENIFAFGSKEKLAFVGSRVAGHLQKFGKDRWQPTIVEGTYGVSLTRYHTFAGDLMVHLHPQFRMLPGMENAMLIIDFPYVKYRYMQNRDTQLLRERQGNGTDGKIHEYLTECGLELTQDKVHSYITNWTDIAS